jgi:hypothetical protein
MMAVALVAVAMTMVAGLKLGGNGGSDGVREA